MLYIFGGLPGTGKSTLSLQLARDIQAFHLRVDSVENALRDTGTILRGPEGYMVGYKIAADNLNLGRDVIADCVNPVRATREAWRDVARRCEVPFIELEAVCSDPVEHRRRIEARDSRLRWADVLQREYDPWDGRRLILDTAGQTVHQSYSALRRLLKANA
jgi:predicted kinase